MFPEEPIQNPHHKRPVDRRLKRIISLATTLLIVGLWYIGNHHTTLTSVVADNQPGLSRVVSVDDGDTIRVQQGSSVETVRFIGMDTPEVKDPRKPIQCYGHEASNETKSLLAGKSVRLVADSIGDNRDKYHRLLRYVYLPDGTFVNELLIQKGYAFAYIVFPFDKMDQFKLDEAAAHTASVGLWKACTFNASTEIKQTNPV